MHTTHKRHTTLPNMLKVSNTQISNDTSTMFCLVMVRLLNFKSAGYKWSLLVVHLVAIFFLRTCSIFSQYVLFLGDFPTCSKSRG
jgi:hypothetical protein